MPEQQTRLLAERYELIAPLGRGTMGTVWRARDRALGREVAVKEIRHDPGLTEEQRTELRERMVREGRLASRINHPAVAAIHDVLIDDGGPWIIMELVEGRSLEQVIDEEGPLPPRLVAEIGVDLLGALRAAHVQGITHRDVKPGNVLITENGRVVLTDFGIAKAEGDSRLTKTGMVIGSPGYTAPERARGEYTGPESDIWSLGATLYFAVEGRPAYERSTIAETLAALLTESADPPTQAGQLRPVLNGLLNKDYRQRLNAAKAETLLRMVADTPTSDMPVITAEALMAQEVALPDPFAKNPPPGSAGQPQAPGAQPPGARPQPQPPAARPQAPAARGQEPGARGQEPGRQPFSGPQSPAATPPGPRGAAGPVPGGQAPMAPQSAAQGHPGPAPGRPGHPQGPAQGPQGHPQGPPQGPESHPHGRPQGGPAQGPRTGPPTGPQRPPAARGQGGVGNAFESSGEGYDPDRTVSVARPKGPFPTPPQQPADEGSVNTMRIQSPIGSPGQQVYPPASTPSGRQPDTAPNQAPPQQPPHFGPQQGGPQVPFEGQGLGTDLFSIAGPEEQKQTGNRNGMLVLMAVAAAAAVVIAVLIVALFSS
ncbi:serine/threonine protein kinase [Nonomuraea wenchangensis]|uniref:serine/threonine protein kinase n=1 Tax=Nonomuraea wenchangensis TaxID=568860 RepID=UPI003327E588